jgi:DNA modification methylase
MSPWVWDDVVFMRCLNANQAGRKSENHICPLPLDIVERVIEMYSNPGDVVLDPFAGLFTVPYCAIKLGRRGMGFELNERYFDDGVTYCADMERRVLAPTLFDAMGIEGLGSGD